MKIVESSADGRILRIACQNCGAESALHVSALKLTSGFRCSTCSRLVSVEPIHVENYLLAVRTKGNAPLRNALVAA
jgi:ribosomal protein S27E